MTEINAKLDKWDPLKQSISEEVLGATIKREIMNILKSYTGWYDPLCELMQNSLDAVDMRKKLNEKDYIPGIWIKIDMHENLICITDNGIGFKETEFKNFLAPNVSFKRGDTRGNKGVGATYSFNEIDKGSTFVLKLIGDYIRPKDLKWVGANDANQWEVVLRIKTPLGGIYFDRECLIKK
jgi:light-regulated signal transduction histidine kinase (bacteriophytochrome)